MQRALHLGLGHVQSSGVRTTISSPTNVSSRPLAPAPPPSARGRPPEPPSRTRRSGSDGRRTATCHVARRALRRPAWRSFLVSPDPAPLAPRAGPLEVGALRPTTSARSTRAERRASGADRSLAQENSGWGYRRFQGKLLKLGYHCCHGTVRNVLRRHGLQPAARAASVPGPTGRPRRTHTPRGGLGQPGARSSTIC